MLGPVMQFVIFFLAVYGALSLVIGFVSHLQQRGGIDSFKTRLVLLVKDQEDTIEGIVRTVFMEHILRKVMSKDKLIVVDMGSKDETLAILNKLKEEYKYIEVYTNDQKEKIFETYEGL